MSYHFDPRVMAEMVLPRPPPSHFSTPGSLPILRPHRLLGINTPSIQVTDYFHIHCAGVFERVCVTTNPSLTMIPAIMQTLYFRIIQFDSLDSFISMSDCVSLWHAAAIL